MLRRIEVVPYDPTWPVRFAEEAARLTPIFGENLVTLYHIGSTAVPGLHAKPIIDMLPEVYSLERVEAVNDAMSAAGYEVKGENGIPGRRYFRKGAISIVPITCTSLRRGILKLPATSIFAHTYGHIPPQQNNMVISNKLWQSSIPMISLPISMAKAR